MAEPYSFMNQAPKVQTAVQPKITTAVRPTTTSTMANRPGMTPTGQMSSNSNVIRYGSNTPPGPQPGTWTPPTWNPQQGTPGGGTQAVHGGGAGSFFGGDKNIWNSDAYKSNDAQTPNYISSVLPVAQFDQNNYQYAQDFNEAQRRYNQEQGLAQRNANFQEGLSGRQQQMAEWQAQTGADQWGRQFDWTRQTDQWGNDLANRGLDIQGREVANTGEYQRGLVGNQANLNAAQGQYWQGQNMNDQFANEATRRYQQGLISNQGFSNQTDRSAQQATAQYQQGQNANDAFANRATQEYQRGLIGVQGQANNIDQMYKTGLISNEQRNMALQELTQQQNNTFLNTQLAQQAQQAQLERENMMRMTAMQTYGRSQAPNTNWSRSWN